MDWGFPVGDTECGRLENDLWSEGVGVGGGIPLFFI